MIYFHLILFSLLFTVTGAYASSEQEDETLRLVAEQLARLQPLIDVAQAQAEQTPPAFHYDPFQDTEGEMQPGLRQDIERIRDGILAKLASTPLQPATIVPIHGDYLSDDGDPHD